MRHATFLALLLGILWPAAAARAQRQVVVARAQPEKVYAGQTAQYVVWAFGVTEAELARPPRCTDATLEYQGGEVVRFDMFDVMSRRVPSDRAFQMTWEVRTERPGRVTIEAPAVRIGSREVEANAVTLQVVGTTPRSLAFCELTTDFRRVLRSQRAQLHVDFYFAAIRRGQDGEEENPFDYLAQISGLRTEFDGRTRREYRTLPMEVALPWLPSLPDGLDAGDPRRWIDGLVPTNEFYLSTPFRGGGLLGGNLTIPLPPIERVERLDESGSPRVYYRVRYTCPFEANGVGRYVLEGASLRGTTARAVGTQVQRAELHVVAEPLVIEVVEPPAEGRPERWTGAIGTFELLVGEPTPREVSEGDVIFLTVVVRGRGQLAGVELDLEGQEGFRERFQVLQPKVLAPLPPGSEVPPNHPTHPGDWRQFEVQLVPLNAAVRDVPPITFSFYDPELARYRTLRSPSHPITVKPRARGEVVVATEEKPSTRFVEIEAKDEVGLAPIVADLNALANERVDPWPYLLFLLACPLVYLAIALPLVRARRRDADPRARRRRDALRHARALLDEARGRLAEDRARALELAARSACTLVADVRCVPREGSGARDVLEHAREVGLSNEHVATLERLFADAEAAAFGGAPPDDARTRHHLEATREALAALFDGTRRRRSASGRTLAGGFALAFLAPLAQGQGAPDREELFQRAERRYAQEDFRGAAELYERILDDGYENGAVLYNLGNAWFRAGELGRAIAAYRRAQRLRPDDRNLRANLERARAQRTQVFEREDRVDLLSYLFFWRASHGLRTQWLLTCAFGQATLVAALVHLFARGSRRFLPWLAAGVLATTLLAIGSVWTWQEQRPGGHAVILEAETPMRPAASEAFEPTTLLAEGTEVRVLGEREGEEGRWLQIAIGEAVGFVRAERAVVF